MKRQDHRRIASIAACALVFLSCSTSTTEGPDLSVYTKLPAVPEGLCVDSQSNLYATVSFTGELVKLNADGTYHHVAYVPSEEDSGKGQLIGIEADNQDYIYAAYKEHSRFDNLLDPFHPGCRDVTIVKSGVYRVDPQTGEVVPILTRGDGWPVCFPDDVDIDDSGNIYVSDLTYAGIWKISPDGEAKLWSSDPLLNWSDPILPLGINVLVLDRLQENVYAATTTIEGRIVRIPIKEDGSAGEAVLHSRGHTFFDGIEIDDEGYIYASEPGLNQIIVVSPEAAEFGITPRKVITMGPPLQGPTSLALRDGVLYTANLAYGLAPELQDKTVIAIEGFSKRF